MSSPVPHLASNDETFIGHEMTARTRDRGGALGGDTEAGQIANGNFVGDDLTSRGDVEVAGSAAVSNDKVSGGERGGGGDVGVAGAGCVAAKAAADDDVGRGNGGLVFEIEGSVGTHIVADHEFVLGVRIGNRPVGARTIDRDQRAVVDGTANET